VIKIEDRFVGLRSKAQKNRGGHRIFGPFGEECLYKSMNG